VRDARPEIRNSQNVRLIMMFAGPNLLLISHWGVLGKRAVGRPQLLVLTELAPLDTSEGMLVAPRGQNQILMNFGVRSIAYLCAKKNSQKFNQRSINQKNE
jgi:hypothetical protein